MKVFAVYSIPKSPKYILCGLFKDKESAKKFIKEKKENDKKYNHCLGCEHVSHVYEESGTNYCPCTCHLSPTNPGNKIIYDIQIEEVQE